MRSVYHILYDTDVTCWTWRFLSAPYISLDKERKYDVYYANYIVSIQIPLLYCMHKKNTAMKYIIFRRTYLLGDFTRSFLYIYYIKYDDVSNEL